MVREKRARKHTYRIRRERRDEGGETGDDEERERERERNECAREMMRIFRGQF